jgi:plasmid replication initiation protein
MTKATYAVAFYEIDRAYGGSEEGGWWYDTGTFQRILLTFKSEDAAYAACRRANRLLDVVQRGCRDVGSVIYGGGRYHAQVYDTTPPAYYPETRPYYE